MMSAHELFNLPSLYEKKELKKNIKQKMEK